MWNRKPTLAVVTQGMTKGELIELVLSLAARYIEPGGTFSRRYADLEHENSLYPELVAGENVISDSWSIDRIEEDEETDMPLQETRTFQSGEFLRHRVEDIQITATELLARNRSLQQRVMREQREDGGAFVVGDQSEGEDLQGTWATAMFHHVNPFQRIVRHQQQLLNVRRMALIESAQVQRSGISVPEATSGPAQIQHHNRPLRWENLTPEQLQSSHGFLHETSNDWSLPGQVIPVPRLRPVDRTGLSWLQKLLRDHIPWL